MKDADLPKVEGWLLNGSTYKRGGKAALFNEEDQTLSVGYYIPAGAQISKDVVKTPQDITNILSKYCEK